MTMLPGVYAAQKKDGTLYYRSSITYQNKHISLGSYINELQASSAYQEASMILCTPSHTIDSFDSAHSILPFEKWVVLINFRDNRIYFKTPIYLRKNYFEYYITQKCVLKFAVDDLFYYSTHKIMKRGGHLFVADFGMQVNILSRYGIKNFAVPGKDYLFMNGDCTDYRYENIQIINKYHGVSKMNTDEYLTSKGVPCFISRIHINGDFIIGRYSTEEEAAIAYNKAAHILSKKGIQKNFPMNYISELSTEQYQEIYHKIRLSSKIVNYGLV